LLDEGAVEGTIPIGWAGALLKASSISSFDNPFLSKKLLFVSIGEPMTFGCARNWTALEIWSSRNNCWDGAVEVVVGAALLSGTVWDIVQYPK